MVAVTVVTPGGPYARPDDVAVWPVCPPPGAKRMEVHGRRFGAVAAVQVPDGAGRDDVPMDDRPGAFSPAQHRRILLERGRRCAWCGWSPRSRVARGGVEAGAAAPEARARRLQVDHIVPIHFGGGNTEANAAVLCANCHEAKSDCEVTLTHRLPEHFADRTHPAGGADGWYVRGGAGWTEPWELGPEATPFAVMLRYRVWACERLRGMAAAGWDDPLAGSWLRAGGRAAGMAIEPAARDPEPTPFHVRWGCLGAVSALSDDAADADRRADSAAWRVCLGGRRPGAAGSGRSLAVRAWWRSPRTAALSSGWRLLAPAAWLCEAPPQAGAPAPPARHRRRAAPVYPPVPKPTLRPRTAVSTYPRAGAAGAA